jgi:hypothetical protein
VRRAAAGLAVAAVLAVGGSAGATAAPGSATWKSNYFRSPTGNIRCHWSRYDQVIACITLNNYNVLALPLYGRPFRANFNNYTFPVGPTLYYGDYWVGAGQFRCDSRSTGMTCTSLQSGRGFTIAREGYRVF